MRISYKKLWIMLIEKEISPATLRKDLNIATGTMTKMRRNEEVALSVLLRICEYLNCNIGDICDAVRNDERPAKEDKIIYWEEEDHNEQDKRNTGSQTD